MPSEDDALRGFDAADERYLRIITELLQARVVPHVLRLEAADAINVLALERRQRIAGER